MKSASNTRSTESPTNTTTLPELPLNDLTAGVDRARDDHAMSIVDGRGREVYRCSVEHTAAGLRELVKALGRHGVAEIAIERPDGAVIDALLAAGLTVVVISPNQVKNLRGRYGSAGNKDDRFDAYVLADTLRTDRTRLRALVPDTDATIALRRVCRARKDLVKHRVATANQPRAHLLDPTVLHQRLLDAPRAAIGEHAISQAHITASYLALLRTLLEQIKALAAQIERQLHAHADAHIFTALPRPGRVRAARLLGEIGDCRSRFPTPESLTCRAGAAPSTRQPEKLRVVGFRWSCDKQLRDAVVDSAADTRLVNPWAADLYDRARARGHDHAHAVRILARAWLHII